MNKLIHKSHNFLKLSELLELSGILKQISEQKSFLNRLQICQQYFKRLAAGSSRIVFLFPNNLVLKLAKNQKGIHQNSVESDGFLSKSWIVNAPIDSDPNNYWIITNQANKMTESSFNTLTKIDWDVFCKCIKYWKHNYLHSNSNSEKEPTELKDLFNNNEFFEEVSELVGNMSLSTGDLCRLSSWGIVNGQIKLIDAGLTDDIYKEFYKK